jgi:hypothetical protein
MADDHDGDTESVTIDVTFAQRDGAWYGAPLSMRTTDPRDGAERVSFFGGAAGVSNLTGTHPVLFATAGKHHSLHEPEDMSYGCQCGPFGRCGGVHDRADGEGAHVVPAEVRHAPGFFPEQGRLRALAPVDEAGERFWNACTLGARGAFVQATRSLGPNDLSTIGYPGERLFGPCFRGGFGGECAATVSVAAALSWPKPFATAFGSKKLIAALLGVSRDPSPTRTTVLLPFGAAPTSIWRY